MSAKIIQIFSKANKENEVNTHDRIERIRQSLERINAIMADVKKQSSSRKELADVKKQSSPLKELADVREQIITKDKETAKPCIGPSISLKENSDADAESALERYAKKSGLNLTNLEDPWDDHSD